MPDMAETNPIRFLLLAEGDAETNDSWSGSSKSIVDHLRRRGHRVQVGNVELGGVGKWVAAGASFSFDRQRWRSKYRIGDAGFRLRSDRAARFVERHVANTDVILQIGATFESRASKRGVHTLVICDSNIRMAQDASALPYTEAGLIDPSALKLMEEREARIYREANAVLTLSERARRSFIEDFRLAPSQVTTIYAGPNAALPAGMSSRLPARSRVLFVGRQFERKGGDTLLAAFREVRRRVADAELWIVGPPARESEPGVRWLGFLSQDSEQGRALLAEAFDSAAVYCLPTRFEPLGISFIEAMHLGMPCIGTNVWAVPEMILDGETGFVVPVDDPHALANSIVRVLSDSTLAVKMGNAGRQRAQAMFTWDHAVDRLLGVANNIVRQ
jgi:alpha-maltose-1-phosphate synthase